MKRSLKYIGNLCWLMMSTALVYYLLVQDRSLHLSIPDILSWASKCPKIEHILVIALLPIYMGLFIYGAVIVVLYLRTNIWPNLSHYLRHCLRIEQKS